jgi:hypothetical protein
MGLTAKFWPSLFGEFIVLIKYALLLTGCGIDFFFKKQVNECLDELQTYVFLRR